MEKKDNSWSSAKKDKHLMFQPLKVTRMVEKFNYKYRAKSQNKIQKPLKYFLNPKLKVENLSSKKVDYSDYLLRSGKDIFSSGNGRASQSKASNYECNQISGTLSEELSSAVTLPLIDSSTTTVFVNTGILNSPSKGNTKMKDDSQTMNHCFKCGKNFEGPCFSCIYRSSYFYDTENWKKDSIAESNTLRTHVSETVYQNRVFNSDETCRTPDNQSSCLIESNVTHVSESILL
ncbi:uncharacterized protein LOC136027621 [Artemia franciscana]|uniref:uncharacterized protein LOC136027621 n=1 Tax=Artemia franciscana TaxID=6661 RepID=UPI0032DA08D0